MGSSVVEAAREAGTARFRPIVLTSATTFAGLTPLLLERSVSAQFLIPMAISLAFGVAFATLITLLLLPCLYLVLDDVQQLLRRQKQPAPARTPAADGGKSYARP
jgi:multidrug efflux pump subunit AcrB